MVLMRLLDCLAITAGRTGRGKSEKWPKSDEGKCVKCANQARVLENTS
jgi:hypothetical protein